MFNARHRANEFVSDLPDDVLFVNEKGNLLSGIPATTTMATEKPVPPKKEFQSHCKSCAGPLKMEIHTCEYCGCAYRPPNLPKLELKPLPSIGPPPKEKKKVPANIALIAASTVSGVLFPMAIHLLTRRR